MTAGGLVTSLRHRDTTRVFAWLVYCLRVLTCTLDDGNRPVFSQTRYSRVNVQKAGHCSRRQSGRVVARGDGRARTGDPLLAKQVLFQLSYIPERIRAWAFVDSNHRPHGYQPCALTNGAKGPSGPGAA